MIDSLENCNKEIDSVQLSIRQISIHAKREIIIHVCILNRYAQTVSVGELCVLDFYTATGGWKRYEEKLADGGVVSYNAIGFDVLPRETLIKVYTIAIFADVVEGRKCKLSIPYIISGKQLMANLVSQFR